MKEPRRADEAFNGPWLSISSTYAVRFDGSLWQWPGPVYGPDPEPLIRVGRDSDWKKAGIAFGGLCALKDNGTLWLLGWRRRVAPKDQFVKFSKYSDWVNVATSPTFTALAGDGTIYLWDNGHGLPGASVGPDLLGPSRKPLRLANVIDTPR